jgi:2-dehydro-3-deoxyphosphogluconate aldolase/(4S)-4-hydroxy-2-oxoglutarate aldolase
LARFTRIEVALKIAETGVIPVFFHPDIEVCKGVLEACYWGGIRVFEFTNRGDFAHELFADLNRFAAFRFPDLILGIGTVLDAGTASLYLQLGANFVVSPLLREEVALVCNRRKVAWIPGAGSVTEVSRGEELGAEFVKIFPGNVLGPGFVQGIKGPMPWTSLIVTGGVEPEENNLKNWFKAGVSSVGIGSQLFAKEHLQSKNFSAIQEKVTETMAIVARIKQNM